jgi:LAS superfamily LD-carboxypeptidase LdcB
MTTKHNRPAGANGRAATAANDTNFQRKYSTPVRVIPVRRADGRIVGELAGDVLRKHAKREHMLREPAAWAWDSAILDTAEQGGAQFTEVQCGGLIYRATLADFKRYGFPVRRGYGDQRGLALTYWHVRRVGEPPAAVQLSLFGGAG